MTVRTLHGGAKLSIRFTDPNQNEGSIDFSPPLDRHAISQKCPTAFVQRGLDGSSEVVLQLKSDNVSVAVSDAADRA